MRRIKSGEWLFFSILSGYSITVLFSKWVCHCSSVSCWPMFLFSTENWLTDRWFNCNRQNIPCSRRLGCCGHSSSCLSVLQSIAIFCVYVRYLINEFFVCLFLFSCFASFPFSSLEPRLDPLSTSARHVFKWVFPDNADKFKLSTHHSLVRQ